MTFPANLLCMAGPDGPEPPGCRDRDILGQPRGQLVVCPSSAHRNSRLNQWRSVVGRILRLHQPSTVSSFLTLTPPHPSNLACLLLDATYHTDSSIVSEAEVFCCLPSKLELEDSGHRAEEAFLYERLDSLSPLSLLLSLFSLSLLPRRHVCPRPPPPLPGLVRALGTFKLDGHSIHPS